MEVNKVSNSEESSTGGSSKTIEIAKNLTEEIGKRVISENSSANNGQDSGICSSLGPLDHQREIGITLHQQFGHESKALSYVTSTPIKETRNQGKFSDNEILPSQMILDDPQLSSIDDDLTEHEAVSLASDNECDESSSRLYETKVKVNCDNSTKRCSFMTRFLNDASAQSRMSRNHSFSETIKSEPSSVKRNLFDIPVSPKLKNRVRQRLYTLVNSIEGYEGRINIRDEEENIRKFCYEAVKSMSNPKLTKCGCIHRNGCSASSLKVQQNLCGQDVKSSLLINDSVNDTKVCKCSQECIALSIGPQQHDSNLNHTCVSTVSNRVSERYETVMSSMLDSQVRTLQLHQEQIYQEKLRLAIQKKDQETQARIFVYREELRQMIQVVEDLKLKLLDIEKKMTEQAQLFQEKNREQDEKHRETLARLKMDCEKKVHEAESRVASIHKEIAKSCEEKNLNVLSVTNEKAASVGKEHQQVVFNLNCIINKLRAEKRELESLINSNSNSDNNELVASIAEVIRENNILKEELKLTKQRLKESSNTERRLVTQQEDISNLEVANKRLQEENELWKEEAEKMQKKLITAQVAHKKLMDDAIQESQSLVHQELERAQIQNSHENSKLNNNITILQEKLNQTLSEIQIVREQNNHLREVETHHKETLSSREALEKEVTLLRTQLEQAEAQVLQERNYNKSLVQTHAEELEKSQEHHKRVLLNYQVSMEREKSLVVCEALKHQQEKSRVLLFEIGSCYEDLLKSVEAHAKAQIQEYKKAVRFLKTRIKRLEEA
ncbi:putative leucine-rich repeat-containing protein DDB_G0290503 [Cherax quadricarinatus]